METGGLQVGPYISARPAFSPLPADRSRQKTAPPPKPFVSIALRRRDSRTVADGMVSGMHRQSPPLVVRDRVLAAYGRRPQSAGREALPLPPALFRFRLSTPCTARSGAGIRRALVCDGDALSCYGFRRIERVQLARSTCLTDRHIRRWSDQSRRATRGRRSRSGAKRPVLPGSSSHSSLRCPTLGTPPVGKK